MPQIKFYKPINRCSDMTRRSNEFSIQNEHHYNTHKQITAPRVDIIEDAKEFRFLVEMPGLKKDEIKLSIIEDNVLHIIGKKVEEKNEENTKKGLIFHRKERFNGEFTRKFILPENVNHEAIDAKFENGVLSIVIEKKEAEKPKEIEVKVV